ncbi:MAG: PEP-CTERM sorting domain-containing protein [Opitutales bacterium]|nr:PEP-CTERM sorting domain-containing protein [Opitutales bacterium]
MKNKIYLSLIPALFLGAASVFARIDAVSSGDWNDDSIWNTGEKPAASDTVYFNPGVEVIVQSEETAANITYSSSDTERSLVITEGGDLTFTGTSNFWYNFRLQVTVENGGVFDAGTIAWGSGGWSNITVTGEGSTFTSKFNEMRGSTVNGGSTLLVTDNAVANAGGEWKLNANNSGTMIVEASESGTINAKALYLDASNGATSLVRVLNGGKIVTTGIFGVNYWNNLQSGSTNKVIIAGEDSKISTTGNNSVFVGNQSTTTGAEITSSLQFGYVDEFGNFTAAGKNALYSNYEFKVFGSGELRFLVGAENAIAYGETVTYADAILNARYFKQFLGDFVVDLSTVNGLDMGEYSVALICSSSGQSISFDNYDDILTVIETDNVKAIIGEDGKAYTIKNQIFYLNFEVVGIIPEPSTYAAIFGALAIAFTLMRRRVRK